MVNRTRNTPSKTLAKVHEANQAPAGQSGDNGVTSAPFQAPPPGEDNFELHLHMVAHLDPGYALSAAQAEIMAARDLAGSARRDRIRRAIKALHVADVQIALATVAMAIVMPTWAAVVLHWGGIF